MPIYPDTAESHAAAMQDEPPVTRARLMAALGDICSATLRRYRKSGKVPPPDIDLSPRTQVWNRSTLRAAGINIGD